MDWRIATDTLFLNPFRDICHACHTASKDWASSDLLHGYCCLNYFRTKSQDYYFWRLHGIIKHEGTIEEGIEEGYAVMGAECGT